LIVARSQRARAEKRLDTLSFLDTPRLETLLNLPRQIEAMQESVANLPELGTSTGSALAQLRMTEPGRRLWETNKSGYFKWAIQQLLAREQGGSDIDEVRERMEAGDVDALKQSTVAQGATGEDSIMQNSEDNS
jgi:kinetochore protein Mis12/MTW1